MKETSRSAKEEFFRVKDEILGVKEAYGKPKEHSFKRRRARRSVKERVLLRKESIRRRPNGSGCGPDAVWSVKEESWSVKEQVWSVKEESWNVKEQVWSVKEESWSVKEEFCKDRESSFPEKETIHRAKERAFAQRPRRCRAPGLVRPCQCVRRQ